MMISSSSHLADCFVSPKKFNLFDPFRTIWHDDDDDDDYFFPYLLMFSPQMMSSQSGDDLPALYTLEVTSSAFRINNQGYLVVNEPNLDRDPPNPSVYTFQVRNKSLLHSLMVSVRYFEMCKWR